MPTATATQIPAFWNHMNSIDYNAASGPDRAQRARQQRGLGHRPQHHHRAGRRPHRRQVRQRRRPALPLGQPRHVQGGHQPATRSSTSSTTPSGSTPAARAPATSSSSTTAWAATTPRIDEFTPPVDASGNYTLARPARPMDPTDFTWTYKANSAQRRFMPRPSRAPSACPTATP